MNSALKNGIIHGLISIVLFLIIYYTDPSNLLSWWYMLIWFIILLIFMAKGSSDARIKGEGYINFGKAFLMAWLVSIVSMTISSIWQYIFYTFIDPTLLDFQLGQIADYMGGWLERMGAVDKEQFMDEIYTDLELESMSFIDTISGVVCIGNVTLLPAAIIALIYKREDKRPLI